MGKTLWYYGKNFGCIEKTMVLWKKTMVLWKNYGTSIYTKKYIFLNKYIALELKRFIMEKIWNF